MKILILIVIIIIGAFVLVYKNIDKIKAACEVIKEKTKAIINNLKVKVMNVVIIIKNFFGRIFKSVGR